MKRTPIRRKTKIKAKRARPRRGRVSVGREEWAALRRVVAERAEFRCEAQGCGIHAPLSGHPLHCGQAHHKKYRSHGGGDTADNLMWLCGAHHRAIHDGEKPCPSKADWNV